MLDRHLGPFEIELKIGTGSMAVVYRAFDPQRQTQVALKVLHAHWAEDTEVVTRFKREAEIASALHHPHIVPVYEYGEIASRLYMVMPYMPRGSLAQFFRRPTPVSLGTVAHLLAQISTALDFAHEHGVIHRDLKLENVLLDENDCPLLSDFGIAHVIDGTRLTMTGQFAGTPHYMSPEQVRGAKTLDCRSDLYSLAVIAYLLAAGRFPFTGTSPYVVLNYHLHRVPPTPSQLNPVLPAALDRVLLKGLAKRPEDRFDSAGAFAVAFEEAVSGAATMQTLICSAQPTFLLSEEAHSEELQDGFDMAPGARKPARRGRKTLLVTLVLLALGVLAITQRFSAERARSTDPLVNPQSSSDVETMTVPSQLPGALALSPHVALPTATPVVVMTATPASTTNAVSLPASPGPQMPVPIASATAQPTASGGPSQQKTPPGQDKKPPGKGQNSKP